MDTTDQSSTEANTAQTRSVMAPLTTAAPSVTVALHPLVIMNISEHWTRVRAQMGKPSRGKRSLFLIF